MKQKHPAYAWLILAVSWAFVSVGFFWVFGTVPNIGHWLRWVLGALPTLIVLPFVIGGIRNGQ
jgi:hypothetical protein